ncbi:MAG: CheR family methyltransferase [Desulfobacteraceae bacterium]
MELSERDFRNFSELIYEKCGIHLHQGKQELLKARLAKVLRNSRFKSVSEYYDFLMKDTSGDAFIPLLDSISTNLTAFFREPKHFEFLSQTAVPELFGTGGGPTGKVMRVWCAGCSSGEEAYSIAITLLEALPDNSGKGLFILGTDISTKVLQTAEKGVYGAIRVEKVPYQWRRKYFQKGINHWEGYYRVKAHVRSLVSFQRLNLMEPFSFREGFDVVFCRNVMIYFDKPTQERLVTRLYEVIKSPGYLFIGHSESLTGVSHPFRYIRPSVYKK